MMERDFKSLYIESIYHPKPWNNHHLLDKRGFQIAILDNAVKMLQIPAFYLPLFLFTLIEKKNN